MQKSALKVCYVFDYNRHSFENWADRVLTTAKQRGLRTSYRPCQFTILDMQFKFISNAEQLRGIDRDFFLCRPGSYHRKDIRDINEMVLSRSVSGTFVALPSELIPPEYT